MKARILGIGWITPSGPGHGSEGSLFELSAGEIPKLSRKDVFDQPYKRFGRLDDFSKLGLGAIALALRDAGMEEWEQKRNIGVVASTRYGCLGTDLDYFDTVIPEGGALASPNLFAYTLSNCFLGEAAIRFGLTGTGLVINEADPRRMGALGMALESLLWGESETILAGFCDLSIPSGLDLDEEVPAGALFLVLGKEGNAGGRELSLAADDTLAVDGQPVKDWNQLVQLALGGS